MKFALSEMTALKYFVPIVEEGNRRGIKSKFIVTPSKKYNCPFIPNNLLALKELSNQYNFDLLSSDSEEKDILFTIEGASRNTVKNVKKIISICYSTDFTGSYEKYISDVDFVVFSSKFISEYYNKHSEKNLYLGSPKFDINLDKKQILKKYHLSNEDKFITIFYPRSRDRQKILLEKIIDEIKDMGYKVILKTRGKDPILKSDSLLSNYSFEDVSWHPHTSLELIKISDLIINFSSSVIEETVALNIPMINFHIKPFAKPLEFLYDFSFVENINPSYLKNEINNAAQRLMSENHKKSFEEANKKIFDTKNSSSSIVDLVINL